MKSATELRNSTLNSSLNLRVFQPPSRRANRGLFTGYNAAIGQPLVASSAGYRSAPRIGTGAIAGQQAYIGTAVYSGV